MKILILLVFAIAQSFNSPLPQQRGWRGIIPLHSTRADVERVLGAPTDDCKCLYKARDVVVHVDYAIDRCQGALSGWHVPADTVLRLTVRSTGQHLFSDLKVQTERYSIRQDDTFTTYYANRDEGVEYSVLSNGTITSVSYIPASSDEGLRCSGFRQANSGMTNYMRFDEYGDLDFKSEIARLDNFAIQLQQRPNAKGYVVVYAGKVACPNEARIRGSRARQYLINKRGISPTRIEAIDGGYRATFLVELYALAQTADQPVTTATLATSEVTIIKSRRCRSLSRGSIRPQLK